METTVNHKKIWIRAGAPFLLIFAAGIYAFSINEALAKFLIVVAYLPILNGVRHETTAMRAAGFDPDSGSPVGNFLAWILGLIFFAGVTWMVATMLANVLST